MGRIAFFIYGITCYLLFNMTFLYFIGFIGNIAIPHSVDSGTEAPFIQAIVINLFFISLFGIQHSLMARPAFKQWWLNMVPSPIERSTYVLFSCLVLLLLCWYWQPLLTIVWHVENPIGQLALWGLFWFGWLFSLFASFLIDYPDLMGLRQVLLHLQSNPYEPPHFEVKSVYKYIRHPIMLGTIIGLWATPTMTVGHFLLAAGFTCYIFIGIWFEERDMKDLYGSAYEEYQSKTSMVIPLT